MFYLTDFEKPQKKLIKERNKQSINDFVSLLKITYYEETNLC